jgi:Uma2 family endonuclease
MTEAIFAPQAIKKTPQPRRVSLDAYFRAEEKAVNKHEYHDGIIVTMAGGTFNHDNLATQTTTVLNNFVFDNNYDYLVNSSDTKIRIDAYNKVVYPDALVVCEQPIYFDNRKDTIVNPLIIVEVLSDSTKDYDQTTKFDMYRTIPSFKEYVLIHQDKKWATVYTKQNDNTWLLRDYEGEEAIAILYMLHNCPLPLKRLYRQIKIEK